MDRDGKKDGYKSKETNGLAKDIESVCVNEREREEISAHSRESAREEESEREEMNESCILFSQLFSH